jgi:hypothetical protein
MSNIFKKALGLFVEFEPEEKKSGSWGEDGLPLQVKPKSSFQEKSIDPSVPASTYTTTPGTLSKADADKFEKHFAELFDKANMPGPDYYEFWKMMETLEAAVPDDKTRMTAVFASLQVQGLSKDKLLESAAQYQKIIEKDRLEFQGAVNTKALSDIEGRKSTVAELEKKNAANAAMIQQLTKEIEANNTKAVTLKKEVIDEEAKLNNNKNGYNIACDAMAAMINGDMQKINTHL